ncbi:MAG: hypothetical protein AVDCRST_MAG19-2233, partial [uncultured Thermomicrobiales bacterium]
AGNDRHRVVVGVSSPDRLRRSRPKRAGDGRVVPNGALRPLRGV